MEIQKHSLHSSVNTRDSIANVTDIKTFRSEQKLYRVTGFVIKFIKNLRRSQNKSSIVLMNYVTIEELCNAINENCKMRKSLKILNHVSAYSKAKAIYYIQKEELVIRC